jgi:hypothetical protein
MEFFFIILLDGFWVFKMAKEYKTLEIKVVGQREGKVEPAYGEYMEWNKIPCLGCPRCGRVAMLDRQHKVRIENGLVTIEPSIGCPFCHAHYFIRNGKVEVLSDH